MDTTQRVFTFENAKTTKGIRSGWVTAIRYLAPADASGRANVCPAAGACRDVCLYTAGRGGLRATQAARIRKTLWRLDDRAGHLRAASLEIEEAARKARVTGMRLAVRVNGTSDLPGDAMWLAARHPDIQFYDYTKLTGMFNRSVPHNYHLTASYDPITVPWDMCAPLLDSGVNVAVAFATVPKTWKGYRVINGDEDDLRFLDPKGVIVGLRAKGDARKINNSFVVTP